MSTKTLFLVAVVAFSAAACGRSGKTDPSHETTTPLTSKPIAIVLDEAKGKQLADEYKKDAQAFRHVYRGVLFEINAAVQSIADETSVAAQIEGIGSPAETGANLVMLRSPAETEKLKPGKVYKIEAKFFAYDTSRADRVAFLDGVVIEEVKK